VKLVAVVGDDFAPEDGALLASRDIDLAGLDALPGARRFSGPACIPRHE